MEEINTLDGLIKRLQEIREYIGHDCEIKTQVNRGNMYSAGRIEMVASDYRDKKDCVLIDIDYDTLKWFNK
jgi:hypothetical protein